MSRNALLATIALMLATTAATAQSDDWANKLFKEGAAHDFGTVPHGAELYYRFPITNIYAVPLDIVSVRVSCGCVKATPSAQTLQPRESGFLDVTMDAHRFVGPKVVTIYFSVGPKYISTATLTVSATSRQDVVLNPGEMTFGVVQRGQPAEKVVDVEYAGVLDWKVTEVVVGDAPLNVTLQELYRQPGKVGYRVKAILRADAPPKQYKQDLQIRTNDPATPLVPLVFEAVVQAALSVVPSNVTLGTPKVGETITRKLVVRGSKPFKVLGIDGLGEGIEADLPINPASVQIVTLKFNPTKAGELKRQLHIRTDLENQVPVGVNVEGTAKP
jgi:hypothetical protein